MASFLNLLVSITSLLVTLALGLVVWRIQLIGKRRTELAEETLLAFTEAVDAIKRVRGAISWSNEHEAIRKEVGAAQGERVPGEIFRVTLMRIRENQEHFAAMRKLQILCNLHFGSEVAKPFDDLHGELHGIAIIASEGASMTDEEYFAEEFRETRREWEEVIWQRAGKPDAIADKVAMAQRKLETILAPHLRADAALLPIAVQWRSSLAWLSSLPWHGKKPPAQ
jgi:hypothetical protein